MSMIDERVQRISERANIPEDKARAAAHAAVDFMDKRLPPPIQGNLKGVLEGTGGGKMGLDDLGKLAGGLGGMFGKGG